ncbi:uncharacterized protein Fot_45626 [Forsythia ovata]|uniref:Uncharacterized protein n=1 Tax=Forsythia ovata TaxID=205694 RepID=A0ABD1R705_9LAMI
MVLVVVLALGTKKFVVGITISAFLLIFLEYVGKNACGMLNPCSDAQKGLRLIVQRIQRFFRFKEDNSDQNNEDCFHPGCSGFKNCESMSSFQETKVMEPDCDEKEIMDEHICKGKLGYQEIDSKKVVMEDDESTCEVLELKRRKSPKDKIKSKTTKLVPKKLHRKLGFQGISLKKVMMEEEESKCEVLELKRRKSRKDKIKSKMKKLVPKKLRSSKKEENNSESSEIYSIREDTISICEGDESEDEKNQK